MGGRAPAAALEGKPSSSSRWARFAPVETLRSPGYRCLWMASALWNQARWMDQVVLGWVVLEMTNSAWHVAIIGAIRWLPLLLFGVLGGAVADRVDRRRLLIGAQTLGLAVSLATAALLALGVFDFAMAAIVTFLLGMQWALDWPTRRALIPDLVGQARTMNAVALEAVSMNLTRISGPLLAGALIAFVSPAAAFVVMAGLYVVEIGFLIIMPLAVRGRQVTSGPILRYLLDGLSSLRRNEPIVGVLLISTFMNVLVFPYQQLLPVFARDVLHVDAVGLGVLGAAAGIGSLSGALVIASSGHVPRSGLLFWVGSCVMAVSVVGFALAGNFLVALGLVALGGLGQSAFASLQSTIVLSHASDQLRGRAMGALTLAIGSAPIGTLEIGALALVLGAPLAVALNAGLCVLLVVEQRRDCLGSGRRSFMVQTWEVFYPAAAATGLFIARCRVEATAVLWLHAAPDLLAVTVREGDDRVIARGEGLRRVGGYVPLTRLTLVDDLVSREDRWPEETDLGALVLLPGGEVGTLLRWWHAADGNTWRWSVEFEGRRG